ncbi:MAG: hypothetical protein V7K68_06785 [Nostoc sp.]|uniref:hypothetical protein n=1 Tax=Nostoc sp. TaxID=1180 RepID=UPI002FFBDCF1
MNKILIFSANPQNRQKSPLDDEVQNYPTSVPDLLATRQAFPLKKLKEDKVNSNVKLTG